MTAISASPSQDRTRLVARLTARRDELDALLQASLSSAAHGCEEPAEVRDFKEVAAEDSRVALDEVALARAALARDQVNAALGRVDNGSYGLCQGCGEAIDARRLDALPSAALCTSCQDLRERANPPLR